MKTWFSLLFVFLGAYVFPADVPPPMGDVGKSAASGDGLTDRQYQINRFHFSARLRKFLAAGSIGLDEALLKRLFEQKRLKVQIVSLSIESELLIVRGRSQADFDVVWAVVKKLNGTD